ncbi:sensor histidine kinase [Terracidiphilus gabretensis]|uniref:sensor histidine kinase n=1 Tax=Terracidiphilus gabretensis TaxID=1577687 RepID=UPI0009E92778|nr:HAMP domain-containing sensor histidine kinase [Terracidiphilus gabretensis]
MMATRVRQWFSLKSLVVATVVSMIAILALSFLVFQAIANRMTQQRIDPTFQKMDEVQLESARSAYEHRGQQGLIDYMGMLDRIFSGSHYLLDAHGIDPITGEDHSSLLPAPPAAHSRTDDGHGHWIITHRSQDGAYWFAATGQLGRIHIWTFLPYYFLVLGATAVVFWLAAVGVVLPIRRIASTIALFGQGDLTARIQTKRPDEIGQLARSFDQMAERLQKLIVSERQLLGDISHELRSPLARLKFAIKLARTSPNPQAALDRIERDVDRISTLVADIVEVTFVEGDPALRGAESVPLGDVVQDVVRDCTVEAEIRGCRVELDGAITGHALGSREMLRRAIENVLRNAVRYSPEGRVVEVTATETERCAVIVVRDHGPGVPDEALVRIFDPFYRVEEARENKNGAGSGLGLSIARRAVQAHHGSIAAENMHPGLRVQIALPLISARLTA